jgi:hypothetical protein
MAWERKHTDPGPTRRLIAEIPEPLFKALKMRAAAEDALLKDLVAEALRRFLGSEETGGPRTEHGEL